MYFITSSTEVLHYSWPRPARLLWFPGSEAQPGGLFCPASALPGPHSFSRAASTGTKGCSGRVGGLVRSAATTPQEASPSLACTPSLGTDQRCAAEGKLAGLPNMAFTDFQSISCLLTLAGFLVAPGSNTRRNPVRNPAGPGHEYWPPSNPSCKAGL